MNVVDINNYTNSLLNKTDSEMMQVFSLFHFYRFQVWFHTRFSHISQETIPNLHVFITT